MFETAYFDVSPFGPNQDAQMEKMTTGSAFGLQEGDWYAQHSGGMIGQDSPWVTQESPSMSEKLIQNDDGTWVQQPLIEGQEHYRLGDKSKGQWDLGQAYKLQTGQTLPVGMLYGYDRFGIGANNRDTLNQMVGWNDQMKLPEGVKSPDQIAEDYWLKHYTTNNHGYTDSNMSADILKNIGNDFLNQDQIKQARGGSQFDISTSSGWQEWANRAAQQNGGAAAATQAMNNAATGASSRDLTQFIVTSALAYFGGAGLAEGGTAAGAASGAGTGAATATGAGAAQLGAQAANMYAGTGAEGGQWLKLLGQAGKLYAGGGASSASDLAGSGGSMGDDVAGWGEFAGWDDAAYNQAAGAGLEAYDYPTSAYQGFSDSVAPAASNGANMFSGGSAGQLGNILKGLNGGGGGNVAGPGAYSMNWGGLLGGLMGLYGANQNKNQINNLSSQVGQNADPFASQRGFYQNQLQQSYANPQAMWDSPQWQTMRKKMLEDSIAKDAAGGRLGDFGARDERVAASFMGDYLPKMQQGLMAPAGANANPGAGAGLQAQLAGLQSNAGQSEANSIGYLLNQLFNGQQPTTTQQITQGAPAQNNDLLKQLWLMLQGQGSQNTQYTDVM